MTEQTKIQAQRLEEIINHLPLEKQEYLLGVADGMAMMTEERKEK